MTGFATVAKAVVSRDLSRCTSCGSWLDDAQPAGYAELMFFRSHRIRNTGPANLLTVCVGCQELLAEARRGRELGGHSATWAYDIYRRAGFWVGARERPADVPVWIELPGGPIWFQLTEDGRRVVTTKEK